MNICILTPRFPFPQFGGDVLRINEIAKHLRLNGHRLILVSLSDAAKPALNDAYGLYDKIYFVKRNKFLSFIMSAIYFISGKPLQCGYYYSKAYKALLKKVIATETPDLYVSHLLRMTPYLSELHLEKKTIVEMTDALSRTYTLSSTAKYVGLLKYVYMLEQKPILKYEKYVTTHFPKVVLVSQPDINYLKNHIGTDSSSLTFHGNGVRTVEHIQASYDTDKICFLGNMRSMQNQDAALFFAKKVFPLVKRRHPTAKFYIVGSLPPANIQAISSDDIIITGFVDDLEVFLQDACLMVAPIRVAAGIQNKVLVAMSCGVPVVISSLISQAIPELRNGENCIICDQPDAIAESCHQLITDREKRNQIAVNGYKMVEKYYSWEEKLKGYEQLPADIH